ncbi:hypothetical protein BGZ73_008743 [Actinomortierella ambigua]|nr:hypothetical protein BGZ73_008743 [Actinomortierella ambigua]
MASPPSPRIRSKLSKNSQLSHFGGMVGVFNSNPSGSQSPAGKIRAGSNALGTQPPAAAGNTLNTNVQRFQSPAVAADDDATMDAASTLLNLHRDDVPLDGASSFMTADPSQTTLPIDIPQNSLTLETDHDMQSSLANDDSAPQFVGYTPESYSSPALKQPLKTDNADRLLDILGHIKNHNLTLSGFLTELFESNDPRITQWTNRFHSTKGASRVLEVWDRKVQRIKDYDAPFAESAVDIVVRRVDRELNKLRDSGHYQCPANEISQSKVEGLLGREFLDIYATEATVLTRFLKGVTTEDTATATSGRYPRTFRACISAMLLFNKSQKSNAFQMLTGLYLHCSGCPRRLLEVLSAFGLSVGHTSIGTALDALTEDARRRVQEAATNYNWFLVYDNINITYKHHHQRTDTRDTVENGTAGTVIMFPPTIEVPDANHIKRPDLPDPNAKVFVLSRSEQDKHRSLCRSHIATSIARTCGQTDLKFDFDEIDRLEPIKTEAYNLSALLIEQASLVGNLNVVDTYMKKELGLDEAYFDDHVEHQQTLQDDQLGQECNKNQADISKDQVESKKRAIIVAGDQLTNSRLRALQFLRGIDPDRYCSLRWMHPVLQLFHLRMTLCKAIFSNHFGAASVLGSLASSINLLRRVRLTQDNAVFHDTDELIKHVFDAKLSLLWESLKEDGASVGSNEVLRVAGIVVNLMCNNTAEQPSVFGRPCTIAEINTLLFLRDAAVYIELVECIKAGDIGRIANVLPTIAVMLHAKKHTNYARELLRLLLGHRDGWMATDMYQETNNYLLKGVFATNASNMSWSYFKNKISPNIRIFSNIAHFFERGVGSNYNSFTHQKHYPIKDIELLKRTWKEQGMFCRNANESLTNADLVDDLQVLGAQKMMGGAIARFLRDEDELSDSDFEDTSDIDEIDIFMY